MGGPMPWTLAEPMLALLRAVLVPCWAPALTVLGQATMILILHFSRLLLHAYQAWWMRLRRLRETLPLHSQKCPALLQPTSCLWSGVLHVSFYPTTFAGASGVPNPLLLLTHIDNFGAQGFA